MGLMADLGRGPVGVDTAIFLYFIEERPQFLPLVEPLFREADEGYRELITSAVTLFGTVGRSLSFGRPSAGRAL
jgi:hypothetical protein